MSELTLETRQNLPLAAPSAIRDLSPAMRRSGAEPVATGVKANNAPCDPVSGQMIYIHPRIGHVWVDVFNRYPPLADEAGIVLSWFPRCTRVIRVTGAGVPVGYRRWEVR